MRASSCNAPQAVAWSIADHGMEDSLGYWMTPRVLIDMFDRVNKFARSEIIRALPTFTYLYLLQEKNEATIIELAKANSIGARAKFGPSQQLQLKSEDWLITLIRV